jgi:APA family basic amino acid/polyamine antiporter
MIRALFSEALLRLSHQPSSLSSTSSEPARNAPSGRLHQALGVTFGIAVAVGNGIAAGILRAPGEVAGYLPYAGLFLGVWVAGGIYALISSMQIAELGALVPRSGGQYVFARRAIGPYAGFVVGWSDWLSTCGTISAVSIVIGEYLGDLFPELLGFKSQIAIAVAVLFALLQWRGIKWGERAQEITSLLKGLVFAVVVVGCFVLGGRSSVSAAATAPPMSLTVAVILALQAVIYTYDGWNGPVYFSEEMKDPGRQVPRALFGSVFSMMGIYLMVNLALVYVLPVSTIAGDNFALGTAAAIFLGPIGKKLVLGLMVLSLLSAVNANTLMATRVLYAVSRDGLVNRRAALVNPGGTPTISLVAGTVATIAFIATGTFEAVAEMLAYFFVANYTISFASLFVLRRREPETPRPYRAWGYPYSTGLVLLGSLAFLVSAVVADFQDTSATRHYSIYALALLILSYPAYRALRAAGYEREG